MSVQSRLERVDARAVRVGRRLGRLLWMATETGLRAVFVAAVCATFGHALQPGMAFGAYFLICAGASLVSATLLPLIRRLRQRPARE